MGEKIMEKISPPINEKSWLSFWIRHRDAFARVHPNHSINILFLGESRDGFEGTFEMVPKNMTIQQIKDQVFEETVTHLREVDDIVANSFTVLVEFSGGGRIGDLSPDKRAAFDRLWNYSLRIRKL